MLRRGAKPFANSPLLRCASLDGILASAVVVIVVVVLVVAFAMMMSLEETIRHACAATTVGKGSGTTNSTTTAVDTTSCSSSTAMAPILSEVASCVPVADAAAAESPVAGPSHASSRTGEASLPYLLLCTTISTSAGKLCFVLVLCQIHVAELIHVPPVRAMCNSSGHAAAQNLVLLGVHFGLFERDLGAGVGEDAVVAWRGRLFGDTGEAVAEFGDRHAEIG